MIDASTGGAPRRTGGAPRPTRGDAMNKHQLENLQVHARLLGGACLSKKYGKCTDRLR